MAENREIIIGLRGKSPLELAASLRHLPGMVWFDDVTGQGRWGGDWVAVDPEETLTGCFPMQMPPAPKSGEFWAGHMAYDGNWQFCRYEKWLRRLPGSVDWMGNAELVPLMVPSGNDHTKLLPAQSIHLKTDRESFMKMVCKAKEYIAAGDIYQVNLAHQMVAHWPEAIDPWHFYRALRDVSPSPHGAYLHQGSIVIMSASPETFLNRQGMELLTRPIKGTRPTSANPEQDRKMIAELQESEKERAELIMITDLERNDLGRVAETGSVVVESLCALESFAHVHHQVSTVKARLRADCGWKEIWLAMFPGGSITGAPKIRAMEIISELEAQERGVYCGTIGWMMGPDQGIFSIAIRTAIHEKGQLHFHVGSGIVEGSDPAQEYEETLHKAQGMLRSCGRPNI